MLREIPFNQPGQQHVTQRNAAADHRRADKQPCSGGQGAQGNAGADQQHRQQQAALHAEPAGNPSRQRRDKAKGQQRQGGEQPGLRGGQAIVATNRVQQRRRAGKDHAQGGGDEQDTGNQQRGAAAGGGDHRRHIILKVTNEGGYDSDFAPCLNQAKMTDYR